MASLLSQTVLSRAAAIIHEPATPGTAESAGDTCLPRDRRPPEFPPQLSFQSRVLPNTEGFIVQGPGPGMASSSFQSRVVSNDGGHVQLCAPGARVVILFPIEGRLQPW